MWMTSCAVPVVVRCCRNGVHATCISWRCDVGKKRRKLEELTINQLERLAQFSCWGCKKSEYESDGQGRFHCKHCDHSYRREIHPRI